MKILKKSVKVLCVLSVLILTTSCEDFLEETNRQSLSVDDALTDVESFSQLVNNVYLISRENTTSYGSEINYALEDIGTDIVTRGNPISGVDPLNDYVDLNASNYAVQLFWVNMWANIAAANVVVSNAGSVQDADQSALDVYVGEAKFFRAWAYFKLVENYGGVPLVLDQVTTAQTTFERLSEEEIYAQIVMDLEDALLTVEDNPSEYGRVTTDAVRHLLARVLLTRGYRSYAQSDDYQRAIDFAETVIDNHPLVSSFADLVAEDNQRNDEVVFAYLFGSSTSSIGFGNSRHMLYKFEYFNYSGLSRGTLYQRGIGPMPTDFMYSLYTDEDEREEATFRRVMYADEAVGDIAIGDTVIYFPKEAWTEEQIASKSYTVINPDEHYSNDGVTDVHYPMSRKFDDPGAPNVYADVPALGDRDMVMMRGGEAYLIAAEAYLQAGNAGEAATLLNTLRERAGITTALSATDVDIDFILDERARELIGEANRWMDLKRTNKLIERTLLYNPHAALNNALSEKHRLRPIPQIDIDASGGTINQNEGYY